MNFPERSEVGVDTQFHLTNTFASRALAYARQNATKTCAAFGPATLRIEICGMILSSIALDPLRHAATSPTAPVDFHLLMIDGKDTGIDAPALDGLAAFHNGRERRIKIDSRRSALTVNEEWNTRCLIDADKRHSIVWIADAATIPEWVIYDQIKDALHWLSYESNFGLFHAAALRLGAVGCLIAGKGGSGKSTTTAAAIAHGFDMAGDDIVLVETTNVPRVHAVF